MRKHTSEKQQLLRRISEQAETIHQLTHHVHLLQSRYEEEQTASQTHKAMPFKTSNNFGGSYPIFFKDAPEDDQTRRSRQTNPTDSLITAPWPLSDTLDQRSVRSPQVQQDNQHQSQSHDRVKATEKSFVSRMTDGISQHSSSSFIAHDALIAHAAQSSRHQSFEEPQQSTQAAYRTPTSQYERHGTQTENTLQVTLTCLLLLSHCDLPGAVSATCWKCSLHGFQDDASVGREASASSSERDNLRN
jgi:hypothetical protein